MAVQLPNGKNYFATATGAPLVGGRLYTYVPGTSTPKDTYTTSAASVANTNPVVMDARGEAAIYWDGSYDVVLRDAADALIWGPERLEDAADSLRDDLADNSSASNGAALVGRGAQVVSTIAALRGLLITSASKHAFVTGYYAQGDGGGGEYWYDSTDTTSADNGGTIIVATDGGRWKLRLWGPVSVKQFGARGNYTGGSITGQNDTAAIQAAITWAEANVDSVTHGSYSPSVGTGAIYFPQGSYGVDDPLVVSLKVSIFGEGQTEYTYGSRLTQTAANEDLFQIAPGAGSTSFSIEGMVLRSNAGIGTGHLANMVRTGGGAVNSQRYVNCTFAQPQAMALYTAGDDILIDGCLWDVSSDGSGDFIQLGTATALASNVRIVGGNDFFNAENSCIKLVNVNGLTVNGNTMSQPNGTTKTPYFIDAISSTPTLATSITVSGNTVRGPRTFFGGDGVSNVTITGNTVPEAGIGTGEAQHLLSWDGTCTNVIVRDNNFRGSYDTANFWNSAAATSVTGSIGGNTFINNGGAGDAFALANFTGRVDPNYFSGFTNAQISEKFNSTGSSVNPGPIGAGATYTFGPVTAIGAALGDKVQVGSMTGGWVAVAGIELLGYVSATNQVNVEYRNATAGSIDPAAHDIWIEVTR